MARVWTFVVAFWALFASSVAAEDPVVVELFTSQGCSSCPPADALLAQLAERDDVIALALHVDYWDYIGWKDQFADPQHTARQRAYARAAKQRTVYTPEMVIGGTDHVIGTKAMKLAELLQRHRATAKPVSVTATRTGDVIEVTAKARETTGQVDVLAAFVDPGATVEIERGENAGKRLTYHNIVRRLVRIGSWDGSGTFTAKVPLPEGAMLAILVQKPNAGPILGAAQAR